MRLASASMAAAFAGLFLAVSAHAAIVNGGFEPSGPASSYYLLGGGSTAISGWTTTDTGVEWYNPTAYGTGSAHDGSYIVDLANYTYSAGGLQQTFATTPGEIVSITFWLSTTVGSGRDGTCQIVVDADGQSATYTASNPSTQNVWNQKTFTFTADDTAATLRFRCLQNANAHFANIDGVSQNVTTGVNPTTWGVMKRLFR